MSKLSSYTEFMQNITKSKQCLVVGGCELSFSHGYVKTDNIKFANLTDVHIKDKSIDFRVDICSSTQMELDNMFGIKFDIVVLEYLPFDVVPEILTNLQHILTNDGIIVLKGFGVNDIYERLETCQMFEKINTLKNFLITNQIHKYKIINFFGLSKGVIY